MAERYTRLFALPENLYAEGSPVLLAAGALLKDNVKGTVLAQLKIRNLNADKISALKVIISCADPAGVSLGETEYCYLDLNAGQDEEFGQKTAVPLLDVSTRSYTVRVTEVVFEGGNVWHGTDAPWESLPVPNNLETLGDAELVKQYRLTYGEQCRVLPLEVKDLRICACGAIHRAGEICRNCGTDTEKLLSLDMTALKADKDKRLAAEAEAKAESQAKAEAQRAKAKKTAVILTSAAALCLCAALLVKKVIIPNKNYEAAMALADAGQYEDAITAFEAMGGYKDSTGQITACKTAIKDQSYDAAIALLNDGQYEEAIAAFAALNGYKDSAEQIENCKKPIIERSYEIALEMKNQGQYDNAISAFEALQGYKDSNEQIKDCVYLIALEQKNAGQYEIAYEAFSAMGNYKDSSEQMALCVSESLNDPKVGMQVLFGRYEQDNDTNNGTEPIVWTVLEKTENKCLLISSRALDIAPYNESFTDVTWQTCTLRSWLNTDFLSDAFSAEERERICETKVSADKNTECDTNPGNATEDRVFLLSITEAEKYFPTVSIRQCKCTVYAKAQAKYSSDDDFCPWWLRTPGYGQSYAAIVFPNGFLHLPGGNVNFRYHFVRPALWISLNA